MYLATRSPKDHSPPGRSGRAITVSNLSDGASVLDLQTPDAGSAKILLLGTDPDVGQLIERELRNRGLAAHVVQARLDDDLVSSIKAERPLIFAIDPALEIDTPAWCRTACAADPQLTTLLVDGEGTGGSVQSLREHDARDWLRPDDPEQMTFVIAREIAFSRTRRSLDERERTTRLLEAQQKALLRDMGVAIALVQDGIVIEANEPFAKLVDDDQPQHLPLLDFIEPDQQSSVRDELANLINEQKTAVDLDLQFATAAGSTRPLRVALRRISRDGVPSIELVGAPRRESREESAGVRARLTEAVEQARQDGSTDTFGLLDLRLLELDDLEAQLGFIGFEQLVDSVESFLASLLDRDERLFQVAPGRLLVLLRRADPKRIRTSCQGWLDKLGDAVFRTEHHQLHIRMAGVVYANELGEDAETCVRRIAGYLKDHTLTPGVVSLLESDDADLKRKKSEDEWKKKIRYGLKHGGFSLSYMPVLKLDDADEQQYDALLRLTAKDGTEYQARDFIQVAEQAGLIADLDRAVVDIAIELLMDRQREQAPPMRLFVKLSEQTVAQHDGFLRWLRVRLVGKPAAYRQLVFNLQESFLQNRLEQAIALCEGIRHFGAGLSIDYFGTDDRSITLLEELYPDFVKLHASFTKAASQPGSTQNQMQSLIAKAQDEGVAVIAQRVEDAESMALLWQMGVGYVQGFHIKGPSPTDLE